jgi:peptide-methionine (R)-S-oxide reductase
MNINRRTLLGAGGAGLLGALGLFGGGRRSEAAVARFPLTHSDGEWRKLLTPPQYEVLRHAGTERAGSSPLDHEHRAGTFLCAGCANPLFSSKTKFDSGTGWPSFWKPLPAAIATRTDGAMFMTRTEVLCRRCGGHLGHVFDDGPRPTGLRYCMNGVAMTFRPA